MEQVHISYEIKTPAKDGMDWILSSELGDRIILSESGEIILDGAVHGLTLKEEFQIPADYSLSQNYPNPFNPETEIRFSIPEENEVSIVIYDIIGKEVNRIVHSFMKPGIHKVVWDGTSSTGAQVGSGIYFYRIDAGNYINQKKMMLIR